MRIDASSSLIPLDRGARTGRPVTPVHEIRQEFERAAEQRPRGAGSYSLPMLVVDDGGYSRPLGSRAVQALASYAATASLTADPDAPEVLGLDLYA